MRFGRIKEADGSCVVRECDLCGGEIYQGEAHYCLNAQVFCTDCLTEFARTYFAPFLCTEEDGE